MAFFVLEGNSQEGGEQHRPPGRVLRQPLLGRARQAAYSTPTAAEQSVLGVIFDRLLEWGVSLALFFLFLFPSSSSLLSVLHLPSRVGSEDASAQSFSSSICSE